MSMSIMCHPVATAQKNAFAVLGKPQWPSCELSAMSELSAMFGSEGVSPTQSLSRAAILSALLQDLRLTLGDE